MVKVRARVRARVGVRVSGQWEGLELWLGLGFHSRPLTATGKLASRRASPGPRAGAIQTALPLVLSPPRSERKATYLPHGDHCGSDALLKACCDPAVSCVRWACETRSWMVNGSGIGDF